MTDAIGRYLAAFNIRVDFPHEGTRCYKPSTLNSRMHGAVIDSRNKGEKL